MQIKVPSAFAGQADILASVPLGNKKHLIGTIPHSARFFADRIRPGERTTVAQVLKPDGRAPGALRTTRDAPPCRGVRFWG